LEPFSGPFSGHEAAVQSTEQAHAVLHSSLASVLKCLECVDSSLDNHDASPTAASLVVAPDAAQLVSRSECIENYWQSLSLLCEEPEWPRLNEYARFDLILHRKTSHFVFTKLQVVLSKRICRLQRRT
jgi:hypothetical protein